MTHHFVCFVELHFDSSKSCLALFTGFILSISFDLGSNAGDNLLEVLLVGVEQLGWRSVHDEEVVWRLLSPATKM